MESKIYSTVISSSILAFALIAAGISTPAFENVLGQEGAITPEGSVNDTMSGKNATEWANATLAFAQEGFTTKDLVNETIDLGNDTMKMNATLAFAQEDDTGMTQGEDMGDMNGDMGDMNQSQGNDTGMVQGQSSEAKNDGNNEEEEGDDE
jgi:hypothetical protein